MPRETSDAAHFVKASLRFEQTTVEIGPKARKMMTIIRFPTFPLY